MDLSQYVNMLRKHWRMIIASVSLGLVLAAGFILHATPKYHASVKLFVSTAGSAVDVSQALSGSQLGQQRVKSYADIIASEPVARRVIADLGLSDSVTQLQKEITAAAPLDTVLVKVTVEDRSPARAQAIANAVGTEFAAFANTLETPQGSHVSPVKVTVVEPADVPAAPFTPNRKLDAGLGLLLGLAVGIGGAVLVETLDSTVKRPDDLAELTGSVTLGVVGFDPDADRNPLVVEINPHGVRAEAFRQLRTNLQFVDVEQPTQTIVMTSSLPREGKSTTAINLALAMARSGRSVCLIEGDLRRPRVARYVGLSDDLPGLTDVIIGAAPLDGVLQPYEETGLVLLPCGARPPNPSELLGSSAMRRLLNELKESFDIIFIDAPPLLPVTDAAVLATVCDGVVMLVRAGKTRREQVAHAMDSLRAVDARVLGTVLNMVPTRGPDAYIYGYGYGYGYGYAYGERRRRYFRRRPPASSVSQPGPERAKLTQEQADRALDHHRTSAVSPDSAEGVSDPTQVWEPELVAAETAPPRRPASWAYGSVAAERVSTLPPVPTAGHDVGPDDDWTPFGGGAAVAPAEASPQQPRSGSSVRPASNYGWSELPPTS